MLSADLLLYKTSLGTRAIDTTVLSWQQGPSFSFFRNVYPELLSKKDREGSLLLGLDMYNMYRQAASMVQLQWIAVPFEYS